MGPQAVRPLLQWMGVRYPCEVYEMKVLEVLRVLTGVCIWIIALCALALVLGGCSTTPNNEDQFMQQEARAEQVRWEQWCHSNHGVVHIDDIRGRKCYTMEDWLRATQR